MALTWLLVALSFDGELADKEVTYVAPSFKAQSMRVGAANTGRNVRNLGRSRCKTFVVAGSHVKENPFTSPVMLLKKNKKNTPGFQWRN